jgi:uncharacterized membrane protein YkoI
MKTTMHQEAEFWASAAATGGLSETELKAWSEHIATCPTCHKLYEKELAMGMLMKKTLSPEGPDPGFERRIISNFRRVYAGKPSRGNEFFRLWPILLGAGACVVLIAFGGFLTKGEKQSPVAAMTSGNDFNSLPLAVQKTILAQSNGKTVSKCERVNEDGNVSYDIETKDANGEEWGLTVAQDGTLLNVETSLAEIPSAVQTAIKASVGHGELEEIDKTFDDGEISYTATITTNGRDRDFTFEEDGTLSSVEVDRTELTPAVQAAITAAIGQGKLEGIDKTFDDGEITYEATMITPFGQERDFSISKDGKLLSQEVALLQAPPAVQQAISQTLGNGKFEEINQSFVTVDNVMPYEVEGRKDGKPFDFMVGPAGNFLGMEE